MNSKFQEYRLVGIIAALVLGLSGNAMAQNPIFDPIKDVMKAGSAKEMANHLNQSIDINMEGNVSTYSKTQAEFVFRDFFKKHPPKDFAIVHTGSSKGGLQFAIGRYLSGADSYSVLMRVKDVSGVYLIHEISFVKE
ncbi:MAG: DUF4783 domain-containing protein [Cyclobacteriaceae bacterium]